MRLAKKVFSLATPLGVVAVRPEELWRGASLVATAAADRAREGFDRVADSVAKVAQREGDGQLQARRQQAQLIQTVAAKAPRTVDRSPSARPATGDPGRAQKSGRVDQTTKPAQGPSGWEKAWEGAMAVDAFVRGAGDVLSFGKADEIEAGLEAAAPSLVDMVFHGKGLETVGQHYNEKLELQQERDRYDELHRPVARRLGQFAGAAGGLIVGGGLATRTTVGMLPNAGRIVRNAQPVARLGLDMRGVNTVAAAGGGFTGAVDQLAADLSKGDFSGAKAYAASTLAGVAGGVAGRYLGPTGAGSVSGGAAPILQSTAEGRPSLEGAAEAAAIGAIEARVMGGVAHALGKYGSSALAPKWKGRLGEGVSLVKSLARDGKMPKLQQRIKVGPRQDTIADQVLEDGAALLEAKFGRWAKLSDPQKAALRQFGPKYLIDHFLPDDVGRVLAIGAGVKAGVGSRRDEERRPPHP